MLILLAIAQCIWTPKANARAFSAFFYFSIKTNIMAPHLNSLRPEGVYTEK